MNNIETKRPEIYVVLEHLNLPNRGLRFWTYNTKNNTHGMKGELSYKEILFTNNQDEAVKCSKEFSDLPTMSELDEYYKNEIKKRNEKN
jgi:hypothetical protein